MKKTFVVIIVLVLCGTISQAQYNNWAVGFKLGEPTGINIRKYFNDDKAIDVTVGTYGGIYGNIRDYRNGRYKNVGLTVQVRYLWHKSLFNSEALKGYYGFGGQLNSRRYYFVPSSSSTGEEVYDRNISLGGTALAGLEYFMPGSRLSIFLEAGVYAEVLPAFLFLHPNVSGGVRLNL